MMTTIMAMTLAGVLMARPAFWSMAKMKSVVSSTLSATSTHSTSRLP